MRFPIALPPLQTVRFPLCFPTHRALGFWPKPPGAWTYWARTLGPGASGRSRFHLARRLGGALPAQPPLRAGAGDLRDRREEPGPTADPGTAGEFLREAKPQDQTGGEVREGGEKRVVSQEWGRELPES